MKNIEIVKGDITELYVDAIVNVANNSLLGGGGVDGAIHKKVGAELDKECVELNGCMTGEAKITKGYNLNANYIIHTVAPKYFDNRVKNKEELLRSCYVNSYKLAEKYNLKTIAFPCLGMGVYRVHLHRLPQEPARLAGGVLSGFELAVSGLLRGGRYVL